MEGFTDSDLGNVFVRRNNRTNRLTARYKEDYILLTVPAGLSADTIRKSFESLKPRLLSHKPESKSPLFNETTGFKTFSFQLLIQKHSLNQPKYYASLKDAVLIVSYPESKDINSPESQRIIRTFVEGAMRAEAKRLLPDKMAHLAEACGLSYAGVKINGSKSRWGSCSSRKNINLSYFCMLLPLHLIELVILHELCHTIEMNHSERFWQLLNKVTNNNAKQLTQELKRFKTGI
jgi:predicted metal-dependent hydrolase